MEFVRVIIEARANSEVSVERRCRQEIRTPDERIGHGRHGSLVAAVRLGGDRELQDDSLRLRELNGDV